GQAVGVRNNCRKPRHGGSFSLFRRGRGNWQWCFCAEAPTSAGASPSTSGIISMLRRLLDGARHAVYVAGDKIGWLQQRGVYGEAFDKFDREIGRFDDADAAIRAVLGSAAGSCPASPRPRAAAPR